MCYTYLMSGNGTCKQKTPKGHEIPIPTREDFFQNLEKAAKVDNKSRQRRPKK